MKPSYLLVKAGAFPDADGEGGTQLNVFYPISEVLTAENPFIMQTPDSFYSENHISGFVDIDAHEAEYPFFMTDAGYMEWDLELHKAVACDMGFVTSPISTALGILSSFWHAEGMKSFYKGRVSLNGTEYTVTPETSFGYADKNWGREANKPLLLLASSNIQSERNDRNFKHSALAVNGCFPKLFFLPLKRRLMIQLTYMGEDFEFHFASIKCISRCRWKLKETNKRYIWHIKAQNKTSVIKLSLNCTKAQMLALMYENPDGSLPESPLLSGAGGSGSIELYRRINGDLELIDTMRVENLLCMYQE
jgi:hypothetical protein